MYSSSEDHVFSNVSFSFIFMTFYETRARSTIMNNLVEVSLMAQWKKMLLVRRQSSHTGLSSLSLIPIICLVEWNVTSLMKMKVIWLRSVSFLWFIRMHYMNIVWMAYLQQMEVKVKSIVVKENTIWECILQMSHIIDGF